MRDNKNSVKPQELRVNQHYFIEDEDGVMQEMVLLQPQKYMGYIIELPSLNIRANKESLVLINTNFPRDVYVDKLDQNFSRVNY